MDRDFEAIIELEGVSATSGAYQVLKEASLSVPAHKTTAIMGPVGSGKSSLLKAAAGLLVPDSGRVLFRGKDLAAMSEAENKAFRAESAFCFQDAALWQNQSILNNLLLPLKVHRPKLSQDEMESLVMEKLGMVGYGESFSDRPSDLSAGEQKLVSFARAHILDPQLLFMDEPTSSLDDSSAEKILQIVMKNRDRGLTQIVVTHSGRITEWVADYICVIDLGRVHAFLPYDEAEASRDPMVRAVTGRLKKREGGKTLTP